MYFRRAIVIDTTIIYDMAKNIKKKVTYNRMIPCFFLFSKSYFIYNWNKYKLHNIFETHITVDHIR